MERNLKRITELINEIRQIEKKTNKVWVSYGKIEEDVYKVVIHTDGNLNNDEMEMLNNFIDGLKEKQEERKVRITQNFQGACGKRKKRETMDLMFGEYLIHVKKREEEEKKTPRDE